MAVIGLDLPGYLRALEAPGEDQDCSYAISDIEEISKRLQAGDTGDYRLPVIAGFQDLTKEMLVRILAVPKNSIYRQYVEILRAEGVELAVAPRVFEQIAELAIEYKTGARSLRGIFEELMTPILYAVPDDPSIARVEVVSLFEEPRLLRKA